MLIKKETSALIIVDVQEKLVSVMPKPHTFINNIVKLLKTSNMLKIPVICSEQYPKGLGSTISEIKNNINKNVTFIEKTLFSVPLKEGLSSQYIICGIESHVCVLQTAINLAENKKNIIYVVQDAISSRYQNDYLTSLSRMNKYKNIYIVSCEMVLFEWLKKAGTKEFKTISQLIK